MKQILIHCHIFYPELWEELKAYMMNIIPHKFELFVTMVEDHAAIRQDIQNHFPQAHIDIVKNVGYDIAPFISIINKVNLDDYSYIVKLHTKRPSTRPPYFRSLKNGEWMKNLLSFLQSKETFKQCLQAFEKNSKIGMINDYKIIVGKDFYDKKAQQELRVFLKKHNLPCKRYRFVAGSMFVARAEIFAELKHLHLIDADFPKPDTRHSMQLAHVIERFLGYSVYFHNMILTDIKKPEYFIKIYLAYLAFDHYVMEPVKRFLYKKKITKSNKIIIKICKIPVWRSDR